MALLPRMTVQEVIDILSALGEDERKHEIAVLSDGESVAHPIVFIEKREVLSPNDFEKDIVFVFRK